MSRQCLDIGAHVPIRCSKTIIGTKFLRSEDMICESCLESFIESSEDMVTAQAIVKPGLKECDTCKDSMEFDVMFEILEAE